MFPNNVHKNYYKCLAFINFDGLTCEIFFNTFNSFRLTMESVITITPVMAIYPLSKFFKLKRKKLLKSPNVLAFVFSFLIWLNFFFDPYNSEFEIFFAITLIMYTYFSIGFAVGLVFCFVYYSTSFMKAFNLVNYTELSYHESTSTNMFNYIAYASISIVFVLTFKKLKLMKKKSVSKSSSSTSYVQK